jgi:hypothetical protein
MGILSPAAIHPSAEGLSILAILLILSDFSFLDTPVKSAPVKQKTDRFHPG